MIERILKRIRERIRLRQYVMTLHGEEEMGEDDLSIFDIESAILTGVIVERQKEQTTAEWKYLIKGQTIEIMVCDNCEKEGARIRRVTRSYGKGENLFMIENIPVVTCPNGGESYLTAETLHELERLKLHRKKLAQERCIDVVAFA